MTIVIFEQKKKDTFQAINCNHNRLPEEQEDVEKPKEAPVFVLKPEDTQVVEGEWARFCCRVTGFPRPRVMWLLNGHTVINVNLILAKWCTF